MITAMDYFEAASAAAREMREAELVLQFGPDACGASGGAGDPSSGGPTFARFVSDEQARATIDACGRTVGEARKRCAELRLIFSRKADAVELHYVDLMPWEEVAAELRVSRRTAIAWRDQMFEWVDSLGWAHLRSGVGSAEDIRTGVRLD